jgi:hypothetical protein
MTSIEQPFNEPTINVTNLAGSFTSQGTAVPYTHDNLGEENYGSDQGGPVDRQIKDTPAHTYQWYGEHGV